MNGDGLDEGLAQTAQTIATETEDVVFSKEFDWLIKQTMSLAYSQRLEGEVTTNNLGKAQAVLERAAKQYDRSIPGRAPDTELAVSHLFGLILNAEDVYRDAMTVCDGFHTLGYITAKLIMRPKDLSKLGKSGAQTRHASMRALKEWALAQYQGGNWKSANQAAHALKGAVIQHGRSIGAVLSDENAQRTIAGWISKSKKPV